MAEIWKDIKGYEGKYQVSNLGNVRSLNYHQTQGIKTLKCWLSSAGYNTVTLCSNGRGENFTVHRLVAEAFVPNPNNYPVVNHKNEIKTDNRVTNLEWCTYGYNVNYGNCIQRIKNSQSNKKCVKVDDVLFSSIAEAARYLGVRQSSLNLAFIHKQTSFKGHKIELIKKES